MTTNEITGDTLRSKATSERYRDNFDDIFRPLCTECGKRQSPGQIHTCLQHPKRYYHTAEISLSTTK